MDMAVFERLKWAHINETGITLSIQEMQNLGDLLLKLTILLAKEGPSMNDLMATLEARDKLQKERDESPEKRN